MTGALNETVRADDHAADGRAETFTEAEGDGVKAGAVVLQGSSACYDGFPEAGAVAVHADRGLLRASPCGDLPAVFQRQDGASECIFEADKPGGTGVDVGAYHGVGLHVVECQVVCIAGFDRICQCTGHKGKASGFPVCSGQHRVSFNFSKSVLAEEEGKGEIHHCMICALASANTLWGGCVKCVRMDS